MRLITLFSVTLAVATTAKASGKTSIYIDQVAGYSALAPCAENRVSAIVRAQASGCGDDQQLTSFSCFCIDQYTHISSIISTAVQDYCSAQATTLPATLTAPLPQVTEAIEVFNNYCARSTELAWYQDNSTTPSTAPITPAPLSTLSTSGSSTASSSPSGESKSEKSVPVAAIAAPVVIGVLAIAGVVGLLFFLRRRRAASKTTASREENPYLPPSYIPVRESEQGMVHEVETPVQEVVGDTVKYRYELETRPAELEGDKGTGSKR